MFASESCPMLRNKEPDRALLIACASSSRYLNTFRRSAQNYECTRIHSAGSHHPTHLLSGQMATSDQHPSPITWPWSYTLCIRLVPETCLVILRVTLTMTRWAPEATSSQPSLHKNLNGIKRRRCRSCRCRMICISKLFTPVRHHPPSYRADGYP